VNNIAQFSPAEYVSRLHNLVVPGYKGYEGGIVALSSYSSANTMFTGAGSDTAKNRNAFRAALNEIVKGKPEAAFVASEACGRVFSGQGMPDDIIAVWATVVKYEGEYRKQAALKKFFEKADYLQAMADGGCIGMDCIGFVGTYLAAAGVTTNYPGGVPLSYSSDDRFPLVSSVADIGANSVVMLTNGMHIQIIDEVTSRKENQVTVDLCQSASGGPQTNSNVTISAGGGSYLPVDEFRGKMAAARARGEFESGFLGEWTGPDSGKLNAYEGYLRRTMTQQGKSLGWKGGAIFQLGAGMDMGVNPANPVSGSVYVGTMKGGLSVRTPSP
jgi:hypothetical protein